MKLNSKNIIPIIFFVAESIRVFMFAPMKFLGIIQLLCAIGLVVEVEIVRKVSILILIIYMFGVAQIFFPAFTDPGEKVFLGEYSPVIRVLALIGLEAFLVLCIYLLKNRFPKKGDYKKLQ